jgi:hypothetical protein
MTMENVGTMAVLADPQGAVFAIFKGKYESRRHRLNAGATSEDSLVSGIA